MTEKIRDALAGLRPHHPRTVVGDRYAVLVVGLAELKAAQAALGDMDLGPFDVEAAAQAHKQDRVDHYRGMTRDEVQQKWNRP